MYLYYTIRDGYLRHPNYSDGDIPFENIYRGWSCNGLSYSCFRAKEKGKEDVIGMISLSVGNAFKAINYPGLVQHHEEGYVKLRAIASVFKVKTINRTRKFFLSDGALLETSRGKTPEFDKIYNDFLECERLKEGEDEKK